MRETNGGLEKIMMLLFLPQEGPCEVSCPNYVIKRWTGREDMSEWKKWRVDGRLTFGNFSRKVFKNRLWNVRGGHWVCAQEFSELPLIWL